MEIDNNKKIPVIIMLIIILESFFSNTSLLSRGMILNIGALAIGALCIMIKNNSIKINAEGIIISSIMFFLFFFASVAIVNDIRGNGSGYVRTHIGDVFNKNQEIYFFYLLFLASKNPRKQIQTNERTFRVLFQFTNAGAKTSNFKNHFCNFNT
jgi:hypothetical protein